MNINWTPPTPRNAWEKFIGPGATPAELWLQLGGGLLLVGLIALYIFSRRAELNWSTSQTLVALFIALDMAGGVLTNATATAKRWYHRAGQGMREHLGFTAVHLLHLLLVAWLFRDGDWLYAGLFYGYLMLAAWLILRLPLYLQRPFALLLYCGILLLNSTTFAATPGLEWFLPFFFLKLLISHLLKEAPFAPIES